MCMLYYTRDVKKQIVHVNGITLLLSGNRSTLINILILQTGQTQFRCHTGKQRFADDCRDHQTKSDIWSSIHQENGSVLLPYGIVFVVDKLIFRIFLGLQSDCFNLLQFFDVL